MLTKLTPIVPCTVSYSFQNRKQTNVSQAFVAMCTSFRNSSMSSFVTLVGDGVPPVHKVVPSPGYSVRMGLYSRKDVVKTSSSPALVKVVSAQFPVLSRYAKTFPSMVSLLDRFGVLKTISAS